MIIVVVIVVVVVLLCFALLCFHINLLVQYSILSFSFLFLVANEYHDDFQIRGDYYHPFMFTFFISPSTS